MKHYVEGFREGLQFCQCDGKGRSQQRVFLYEILGMNVSGSTFEGHHPHHHSETTDTHHASIRSGALLFHSISYTKNDLGSNHFLNQSGSIEAAVAVSDRPVRLNDPLYFFESTFLPRLLSDYYQLYSVHRI